MATTIKNTPKHAAFRIISDSVHAAYADGSIKEKSPFTGHTVLWTLIHMHDYITEQDMSLNMTDGGRAESGFKGSTGDCVVRAIAIATEKPYREVYDALNALAKSERPRKNARKSSARTGVHRKIYDAYLKSLGWHWTPTVIIGSGCQVHLRPGELPDGRLIVRLSRHLTAVIDGKIHDTFDPSRDGTRCVYGYYQRQNYAKESNR